jgi:hypothetical protein
MPFKSHFHDNQTDSSLLIPNICSQQFSFGIKWITRPTRSFFCNLEWQGQDCLFFFQLHSPSFSQSGNILLMCQESVAIDCWQLKNSSNKKQWSWWIDWSEASTNIVLGVDCGGTKKVCATVEDV